MSRQETSTEVVRGLLQQAEALLKDGRLGLDFGRSGVNTSVAVTAVQGLVAYLDGNKSRAADDLMTAAEEIRARLERGSP